jgi:hypothetical protein
MYTYIPIFSQAHRPRARCGGQKCPLRTTTYYGRTDEHDGRTIRGPYGGKDARTDGRRTDGGTDGRTHGGTDGRTHGRTDGPAASVAGFLCHRSPIVPPRSGGIFEYIKLSRSLSMYIY